MIEIREIYQYHSTGVRTQGSIIVIVQIRENTLMKKYVSIPYLHFLCCRHLSIVKDILYNCKFENQCIFHLVDIHQVVQGFINIATMQVREKISTKTWHLLIECLHFLCCRCLSISKDILCNRKFQMQCISHLVDIHQLVKLKVSSIYSPWYSV